MSYLSANQLKQYNDEGFVSPIDIFSKDKANEIRKEIEIDRKRCLENLINQVDIMLILFLHY